jgi:hypothetical protein
MDTFVSGLLHALTAAVNKIVQSSRQQKATCERKSWPLCICMRMVHLHLHLHLIRSDSASSTTLRHLLQTLFFALYSQKPTSNIVDTISTDFDLKDDSGKHQERTWSRSKPSCQCHSILSYAIQRKQK